MCVGVWAVCVWEVVGVGYLLSPHCVAFLNASYLSTCGACRFLSSMILGETISISSEYKDGGEEYVSAVLDQESKEDVAETIIREGFLLTAKRREFYLKDLLARYSEAQQQARVDHRGAFEYGDISADDAKVVLGAHASRSGRS